MIETTRAIVLRTSRFDEKGVIVKLYTESRGLISVIIKNSHSKRSEIRPAALMPLSLLEAVLYLRDTRGLQKATRLSIICPYSSLHTDVRKSAVALYLADFLSRTLHEEAADTELFRFISAALQSFDTAVQNISSFPLCFTIFFLKAMGVLPGQGDDPKGSYLNLAEGRFQEGVPIDPFYISGSELDWYLRIAAENNFGVTGFPIPKVTERVLLEKMIRFASHHFSGTDNLKSYEILKSVFH